MAIVKNNSLIQGIHGSIGGLVIRQLRDKTIISQKSIPTKKQSERQKENRFKFKIAAAWAKKQLLDPEKKAFYQDQANELKLPNAYTAALKSYLRQRASEKQGADSI